MKERSYIARHRSLIQMSRGLLLLLSLVLLNCTHIPGPSHRVADGDAHGTFKESRGIERIYLGPDGNPLPFEKESDILDFLRTATVQDMASIPVGVTRPKRILLEKDGITARAIFHYKHETSRRVKLRGGRRILHFKDSYRNQVAAYEISRLLGIANVSPTVLRPIHGIRGSVQLWIENAFDERDRIKKDRVPPEIDMIEFPAYDMQVFDNLINNIDRNQTNILYDPSWQFWYIDHTRAFGKEAKLYRPDKIRRCSVSLWEKLQALDSDLLAEALKPYIRKSEIQAVMARRDIILEHLQNRMALLGEDAVLFRYPSSGLSALLKGDLVRSDNADSLP
jgi:hypothetical protein